MQTPIGAFCIFDLVRIRTGVGSGEHLVSRGGRNGKTVGFPELLVVQGAHEAQRSEKVDWSPGLNLAKSGVSFYIQAVLWKAVRQTVF